MPLNTFVKRVRKLQRSHFSELVMRFQRLRDFVQHDTVFDEIHFWLINNVINGNPFGHLSDIAMQLNIHAAVARVPDLEARIEAWFKKDLSFFMTTPHGTPGYEAKVPKAPRRSTVKHTIMEVGNTAESIPVPRARRTIPQIIRKHVWGFYMGASRGEGMCMCCKTEKITAFTFVCGHVVAAAVGGLATVDNLRPICALCNSSMGIMDMHQFCLVHFLHDDI